MVRANQVVSIAGGVLIVLLAIAAVVEFLRPELSATAGKGKPHFVPERAFKVFVLTLVFFSSALRVR